jgi:hypothetical protein
MIHVIELILEEHELVLPVFPMLWLCYLHPFPQLVQFPVFVIVKQFPSFFAFRILASSSLSLLVHKCHKDDNLKIADTKIRG